MSITSTKPKTTLISIAQLENNIMALEDVIVVFRMSPKKLLRMKGGVYHTAGRKLKPVKTTRGLFMRLKPYLEALGIRQTHVKIIPKSEVPVSV